MKVNDLIEFLEYCPARAPVSIVVVAPDGSVVRHDVPWFLAEEGRVCLVVDQRPEAGGSAGVASDPIDLAQYVRPQLFGQQFVLLRKPDQAALGLAGNRS